jgi:hypothetical protein
MVKNRLVRALAALCMTWSLAALVPCEGSRAQEEGPADWRTEFEAVCVKTDLAMTLSNDELTDLVARCDRLEGQIARETEIVRKVYLKRLRSCRALFAYVLETRGAAAADGSTAAPAQQSPPETQQQDSHAPAPEGRPAP